MPRAQGAGASPPTPPPVLSPPPAGPAPSSCAQPPLPNSANGEPSWMSEGPGPHARTRTCPLVGPPAVPGAAPKGPACSTGPPLAPKLQRPSLGPGVREGTINTCGCTRACPTRLPRGQDRLAQDQPQRRVDAGTAPTFRPLPWGTWARGEQRHSPLRTSLLLPQKSAALAGRW